MVAAQGDFSFVKEMTLCASDSPGECLVLSLMMCVLMGSRSCLFTLQIYKSSTQSSLESNIDGCEVSAHHSLGGGGWSREGGRTPALVAILCSQVPAVRM